MVEFDYTCSCPENKSSEAVLVVEVSAGLRCTAGYRDICRYNTKNSERIWLWRFFKSLFDCLRTKWPESKCMINLLIVLQTFKFQPSMSKMYHLWPIYEVHCTSLQHPSITSHLYNNVLRKATVVITAWNKQLNAVYTHPIYNVAVIWIIHLFVIAKFCKMWIFCWHDK